MTEPQRGLKFIVIILGVLIVVSLVVVLTTVAERAGAAMKSGADVENMVPPLADPMPGHPIFFGDVRVTIPSGNRVIQMSISGDRLLLLLEDGAGVQRIHAADAASGVYLGTFHLTPEDQAGS